jgi:fatty-acyl-CoA synthase
MALTLSHAHGPSEPAVRDVTVGQLLAEIAERDPDRAAVIEGIADVSARRQWTYAEFYEQAQSVARALLVDHEPGDRVAVWAHNIPEWLLLEFGCSLAGVVLVTVNPAFQASELRYVVGRSRSAPGVRRPRTDRLLRRLG